jgi:hypothetical protein
VSKRKSQEIHDRQVYFLGDRGSGFKNVSDLKWLDGVVIKYSLALIDTLATHLDNGRVLGYDSAHGCAHRHLKGKVTPTSFSNFDEVREAFEADLRLFLEEQ